MSEGECVKVVVRCRPANSREKELKSAKIVRIDRRALAISLVKGAEEPKTFTFDNVYDDDSVQKDVYDETAFPLVKSVMEGYNGTIFAYGQTGCGKTFSMEGIRTDPVLRGIIPRSFDQIFEAINTDGGGEGKKFLVAVSYVEIYNEEVRDLLSDNPKTRMDVKEDPEKGVFIKNLSMPEVTSVEMIDALMNKGNKNRSVGATAMNATSSRSHSLFTVRIETSTTVAGSDEQHIKAGKLNLVDLAGSERQSKTEATGDRLKEAQKINLSLSALGNVISALVVSSGKGKGEVHIPYRDSKLTRLLQDSLGGNTKTIMLCAVSPAADNYDETLSTLRYANRAKQIKNKPKVNEDPKDAMLREFQDEIKRLKAMLEQRGIGEEGGGGGGGGKKKKRAGAGAEEEEEESEEEEDEAPRPKKVKKKRAAAAGGDDLEDVDDGDDGDDIEDEVDGGGGMTRRKKRAAALLQSPAEQRALAEARADFEAELARIQAEKEKHESFARMLEEQMAAEKEALVQSMRQQTQAETAAALAEVQERLTRDKEEHEARAAELAAEIARNKAEEESKAAALTSQLESVQNARLAEKLALKAKLKKLQQKMLEGGKVVKNAAQEAEARARAAAEEAMALRQAEARALEERAKVEEEKLLLEENYSSVKDEVIGKTRKLKKLRKKFLSAQADLEDSRAEWETEKAALLASVRDAQREAMLFKQVASALLTRSDLDRIVRGSRFDEEKDAWQLPRIDLPVFFPTVRMLPGQIGASSANSGVAAAAAAANASAAAAAAAASKPRGTTVNFNATAKFQEEKGTDSGWKKSVTAGLDRDSSQAAAVANARGGAAAPRAGAAPPVQPSPVAARPAPPSVPAPARLDSLHGGGGAVVAQQSPTSGPRSDPPKRAAFDPAATGAALGSSAVSSNAAAENHARVVGLMDETRGRGPFVAEKASLSASAGDGVFDTLERMAAQPTKRAAFSPAAGGPTSTAADDAHEALSVTLANSPAKRAAFSPATGAAAAAAAASHDAAAAALAGSDSVPKRAAFDPQRGNNASDSTPQTSLPSNLPAARSFQPGSLGSSCGGGNHAAAEILQNHAALPARAAFKPGTLSSPTGGGGGSGTGLPFDDPLANAPPMRANFSPAFGAAAAAATPASPEYPSLPSRPAFQPPALGFNFPDTTANVFKPAIKTLTGGL